MLKPAKTELLAKCVSRYSLVIASAKLGRMIAEEYNKRGEILIKKPVSVAVKAIESGEYRIVEDKGVF